MRILPSWLREFVDVPANDRQLAEALTSAGIAVESVQEENGATIYEMDLTTNRVDAMNHCGVAREASAIYDVDLKRVHPRLSGRTADPSAPLGMTTKREAASLATAATPTAGGFPIVIEDAHGCARYTARIVRNVKIGPSPDLAVKRLELLGSRSINNAADATNYAINELGHPTHAFDLDLLEGGTIIVRRARAGETLKTLDGVDRKLTPDDLIIADAKKPVALAGVMGGLDTMITERTKNVLIESAWFEPWTVRGMAKRHLMHTDASHRFERGADYGITPLACDRVAELILASAGGELAGEHIDAIARTPQRARLTLHSSEVRRHLGIDIAAEEIERILRRLGFGVTAAAASAPTIRGPLRSELFIQEDTGVRTAVEVATVEANTPASAEWSVQVPTWRLDVEREIDLLEEIARIYGYDRFPNTLPAFVGAVEELPDEPKNARVRETMLALGYDETISITFISEPEARSFDLSPTLSSTDGERMGHPAPGLDGVPAPTSEPLALANPLSEEAGYMRTSLLPGLLNQIGYNLNRGTAGVRLFEAGQVFQKCCDRHREASHLAFVATGAALAGGLHQAPQPYSFFHMKGDLEELLASFQHASLAFDSNTPPYLHPGRSARAVLDGETIAVFGQLHPEQAATRKLKQDVFLAEVMLDRLYQHGLRAPRYQRISKFPAVDRDFSFVFDDAVTWEKIKLAIDELRIAELIDLQPAEIYRGEKVGAGKYSFLVRAEFQSQERTLRDDEVAQWSAKIIATLESLAGTLRAQ
jgi:phenylalanyl-tRNA synthetase beta chain